MVVDTIGKGSFGTVKLCLNTVDNTLYAVKVVNKHAVRGGRPRASSGNRTALAARKGPASLELRLTDVACLPPPARS